MQVNKSAASGGITIKREKQMQSEKNKGKYATDRFWQFSLANSTFDNMA